jgi:multimeric flavodoxin WrbA
MNFIVINASPKTKHSITLQHMFFIEKKYPQHQFEYIHIANKIPLYEKNQENLNLLVEKINQTDALIWCFPVYYALVPSQLKCLIEMFFKTCKPETFKGKYATSFTTSINFFDHTAHNYIQGISEELGFSYIDSYSANMDDFFKQDQRKKIENFFGWFAESVSKKVLTRRKYSILKSDSITYQPDIGSIENPPLSAEPAKVLILTDEQTNDVNLSNMTTVLEHLFGDSCKKINIHDINLKNGCLGCCTCGYDNTCVQKDGFVEFYNENLKTADTIIIAGSIKDHYLSAQWKKFFDRSFFNGHAPVLKGKRAGFVISGNLSQHQNLREILNVFHENWHMKPIGVVTDEHDSEHEITRQLKAFAENLNLCVKNDLEFGPTFYQIAGGKIFRDFIFETSSVFRADNIFYKKIGLYNTFPQRKLKKRWKNAMFGFFLAIKPVRQKIHQEFIPGMVAPYKKVLKEID